MKAGNSAESWGWVARVLHWGVAAVILYQLGLGIYMTFVVDDLLQQFALIQVHKSWGFVVFALACIRVSWRLLSPVTPARPPSTKNWQWQAAEATHRLLYLLMFLLPVSGWVMSSASPNQDLLQIENSVFGLFNLPDPWVPGVKVIAEIAGKTHALSALLLSVLLALHIGAALKHHFVDRDNVLKRMTSGR